MKQRLFTLCLALTVVTFGAMAAEELYVGGKKVTLSGSGKVTVSGGDIKSGSVTYDRDTKTLTLKNVTITRSGNNNRGIRSSVSGLTVVFSGTNAITTTTAAGLRFEASATITGSGTVTVTTSETALYVYKNTTVTIKGQNRDRLTLSLSGQYGIQGEDGNSSEKVVIQRYVTLTAKGYDNALKLLNNLTVSGDPNVTLKGNDWNPTINNLASLTLSGGAAIDQPLQGKFDSSKKTVVKGSATTGIKGDVTIKPATAINATNFPDANFRSFITSSGFDQNSDGYLSSAEIRLVTVIDVNGKSISNLKGIDYFTALTNLTCSNNSLQSLDVSSNTKLTKLDCSDNSLESLDVTKNTSLTELYCSKNNLESLDVSKNTALTVISCHFNRLKSLDVSKNTALTELHCSYNSLTTLDVSKNTALTYLSCDDNSLQSLDVSSNTKLTKLYCSDNSMESLDVLKNTALTRLNCSDNSLKSLDVSKNTKLTSLVCSDNSLESLDVSKNTALTGLYCGNNSLESLDVSKNTKLTDLVCYDNQIKGLAMTSLVNSLRSLPSGTKGSFTVCSDKAKTDNIITTAQVKVATDKGWTVKKYDSSGNAVDYAGEEPGIAINETNFPDPNFRNYLLEQDYGKDAVLTEDEILAVTKLDVFGMGIEDLKGIEHFTALTSLFCDKNSLTSLDVSKNTALTELDCSYNSLESLNVSKSAALKELSCDNNSLQSLDVSNNTALTKLCCYNNSLTSLVVLNNTALKELVCENNSLTSLDVSKNAALTKLFCDKNCLTSLDVSKNTALAELHCDGNSLTSLDVSKNTALTWLHCYGNQISGAAMTSLVNSLRSLPFGTEGRFIVCDDKAETDNVITTAQVNIATGKGWTVQKYDSEGNSVDYAGEESISIDATNFPDENFRALLLARSYGKDAVLTEAEILAVTEMYVWGSDIKDLKGIEHFTALTELHCSNNSLTSLDVSKNTALTKLHCQGNSLKSMDVSKNTALVNLVCYDNSLESLDVSKNTALTWLSCFNNKLKSLDVSKNAALTMLDCYNNSLTSLIVSDISLLRYIECHGNQISGAAMTKLVNNLPTWTDNDGELIICHDGSSPDNVITAAQVNIATDKGWTVLKYDRAGLDLDYAGHGDVNGDGKTNQTDLDLIVKIIMGQKPNNVGEYAGDLNNDGKVDAADIVVMNNILKELKGK